MLNVMHHCCCFLSDNFFFYVNGILSFQKLIGKLDKMTIAKLGREGTLVSRVLRIFVFVWSYKLLFYTIYIV
jgi:hypothetical protein